jgi:RelB Antitoxin alpha helical domain
MLTIKKKYIVDENQAPVAVQMDIKTFNKIERLLEDFVLVAKMKENSPNDRLELNEARAYYARLKKSTR